MCFWIKNNFYDDKKFGLYDRLFVLSQNYPTEYVKIVKNPGFFPKFLKFKFFLGFIFVLAFLCLKHNY